MVVALIDICMLDTVMSEGSEDTSRNHSNTLVVFCESPVTVTKQVKVKPVSDIVCVHVCWGQGRVDFIITEPRSTEMGSGRSHVIIKYLDITTGKSSITHLPMFA